MSEKEIPLDGHLDGHLIYDFHKGKHVLRVYETGKEPRSYTDYELKAESIAVRVLDFKFISLYEGPNGNSLDWASEYSDKGGKDEEDTPMGDQGGEAEAKTDSSGGNNHTPPGTEVPQRESNLQGG